MKKHFIISSMLALAMGIAQAQTQQSPAPMQSGTNDPRQGSQRQTEVPPAAAQGMGPGGVNDQAAAQSFKGCLNGSTGSWTLTSDKGKTAAVSGADNQLSPYQGQEVRIQGVQTSDGSITVSSINKVSDACTNQAASNMNEQSSSTSQNQTSTSTTNSTSQSTTATQPSSSADMSNQSTAPATATTPDNSTTTMNGQSSSTSSTTAPGATTPPVSNQTPSNSVGSGQTTPSSAQTPAAQTPSTSTNDQNSTGNQNATSSDQGVRHYSDMDQNAGNNGSNANNKLPQTASPLPLLGFLGLGSLAAGLISRRKK